MASDTNRDGGDETIEARISRVSKQVQRMSSEELATIFRAAGLTTRRRKGRAGGTIEGNGTGSARPRRRGTAG